MNLYERFFGFMGNFQLGLAKLGVKHLIGEFIEGNLSKDQFSKVNVLKGEGSIENIILNKVVSFF